ncbi:uncharacterized protein LOC134244409 [Saccostrea cucullata]|uniref:uncharacterized protein LOC134244409 n=1 Tax=Saccostrea cuccullata TaxID=36930 RepID=UPI002ED549FC
MAEVESIPTRPEPPSLFEGNTAADTTQETQAKKARASDLIDMAEVESIPTRPEPPSLFEGNTAADTTQETQAKKARASDLIDMAEVESIPTRPEPPSLSEGNTAEEETQACQVGSHIEVTHGKEILKAVIVRLSANPMGYWVRFFRKASKGVYGLEEKEFFIVNEDISDRIRDPTLEALGSRLFYKF